MLHLKSFKGGYDNNFSYLVWDDETKEAGIIDAALDPLIILDFAKDHNLNVKFAVVMHSHFDHVVGLKKYNDLGIKVAASNRMDSAKKVDLVLKEDDELMLGGHSLKVIETPGHIEDCICLIVDNWLFTTDCLFIDGCGRCDLAGGNVEKMYRSLQIIKQLPNEIVIYPGHDYGDVEFDTLGSQKKSNPYLKMDKDEFLDRR
jgi:hydroxyacylglutathione hydrolase